MAAQLAALGVPADQIPIASAEESATEVWDLNWTAFMIFRACGTQWRVAGIARGLVRLGLDYAAVDVVMRRLLPVDADGPRIFADLQVMEAAALPILNGPD